MRLQSIFRFSLFAFVAITFFSCDEKEDFTVESANAYMPLAVGKYITYRIDSMVFTNFGKNVEYRKYQVKHRVDALITDNEGRPTYRIFRSIRDTAGLQPWQESGSYFITPTNDQIELSDNNLRFIALHTPVRSGFSWRGNRFMPFDPYEQFGYNFGNDNPDNFPLWDFTYDGEIGPFSYRGINYSNVITVEQMDEAFNVPITSPTSFATKSRAVERYSKNIGLIYREYELWEYQPNTGNPVGPYKVGFGVTMWMIDHN